MLINSFIFCVIILYILYHNSYYFNKIQHNYLAKFPDRDYISLVQESYNPVPDLNYMLGCFKKFYAKPVEPFYIIDSIRTISKSFRYQSYSKKLTKRDGDISIYYDQMVIYRKRINEMNNLHQVDNICEIGFQVGAGSLTLLTSLKDNLKYYGFDYGLNYSRESFNVISKYFDMNMEWGKSEYTIKRHRKIVCDIIHIDGDHNQNSIYNDISNMKRLSNKYTLLFLDDVFINSTSVVRAKKDMIIEDVECFIWKPFCISKYKY